MPVPVLGTVDSVAKAIDKIATIIAEVLSGATVRKLNYRIEAAQNYIFVDEKSGQYAGISDEKQKEYKTHFRKRVFDV